MSGKTRIVLTFSLCVLILLLVGAYAFQSTKKYKESAEWVSHTQAVINESQSILLAVEGIETAQRGYVISSDKDFLKPYNKGIKALPESHRKLEKLISDNPEQQKLLINIKELTTKKSQFAKSIVETCDSNGREAAQVIISKGFGDSLMSDIRDSLDLFISNEKRLLNKRLKESNDNFSSTLNVIFLSIVLTIILILVTLYLYLRDHALRLRYERKLKSSENRIKLFLESLPLGIYVLDANGKPFYTNSEALNILGQQINPENQSGNFSEAFKVYRIGTNEDYPPFAFPTARVLRGESNICVEDIEIEKDGIRIPLRINATHILDDEGKIEYAIAVLEDITDVKETERKLKEAKKLAEESSMLKEAFLANMSHEIRTPMNAIIGFTDLLLKRNLQTKEFEYVSSIKTSSENLLRIINDVLDISKIESGLMTFESHPISVAELFASIHVMFMQRAFEKNLKLVFNADEKIPSLILGDPTRLTQILLNLVGNALKFTEEGSVTITAKLVSREKDKIQIEFAVKDSGIGISEEKLKHVFERFTQAEEHTTRKYGGTGLGLNIVQQLVELQGGKIGVKSVEGIGSEFKFSLTFTTTSAVVEKESKEYSDDDFEKLKSLRILICEDSPLNIKFIFALFDNYGIAADHAENGKIAVQMLEKQEYDLILMDIEMPEMNGYETTIHIREVLKLAVPIIAMTAHTMAGESEKCIQYGMNGYLSKPIREGLLFAKMIQHGLNKKTDAPKEVHELVNLDMLAETMRNNSKVILETIEVFLEQLPLDLDAIEKGISDGSYNDIRRAAHTMRSSASIMGIKKMESLLNEIEKLGASESGMNEIIELNSVLNEVSNLAIAELDQQKNKYKN